MRTMLLSRSSLVLGLVVAACASPHAPARAAGLASPQSTMNGAAPVKGALSLELEPLWTLEGDAEEYLFGVIRGLASDARGNVYLLDGQQSLVHAFSKDGEYLRTIGREGDGPGEFRLAYDIYRGPGDILGVVQIFPGSIVQLTPNGVPAGRFPLPERAGGGVQSVYRGRGGSDRVVLAGGYSVTENGQRQRVKYLKAFTPEGREIAHYHEERYAEQFGGMRFEEPRFTGFQRRWALSDDHTLAAALDFDDYRIHVWAPSGDLQRIIERPYQSPRRTAVEKQRFQRVYDGITRWNPGSSFEVSDVHETISRMYYRPDGSLWVLSGEGIFRNRAGTLVTFDVFDAEGRYAHRVEMRGPGNAATDALYLLDDRIYVVSDFYGAYVAQLSGDDEDPDEAIGDVEPISLTAYRVRWPRLDLVAGGE